MTTITGSGDVLDLAQIAKRKDIYGEIVDLLLQEHSLISVLPRVRCNKTLSNISAQMVGYPTVGYAQVNGFTASSRATVQNVEDIVAMARGFSETDRILIDEIADNGTRQRKIEDMAFVSAIKDLVSESLFYGSLADNADEFNGLAVRSQYSSTASSTNPNVILAGGATTLSSIWVMRVHPSTIAMLVPENGVGGIQVIDHGPVPKTNSAGAWKPVYLTEVRMFAGLMIKDPRAVCRIANIEPTDATGITGTQEMTDFGTNIKFALTAAQHRLSKGPGSLHAFMPRSIFEAFHKMSVASGMGLIKAETLGAGKGGSDGGDIMPKYSFQGINLHIEEALTYAEAALT